MDDGSRSGQSFKWAINSFTYEDCFRLSEVLLKLYGIKTSVASAGVKNKYVIYVFKESLPILRSIVQPYMVSSILYKLGT